jgi:hypothetical protein
VGGRLRPGHPREHFIVGQLGKPRRDLTFARGAVHLPMMLNRPLRTGAAPSGCVWLLSPAELEQISGARVHPSNRRSAQD